jgi:prevent-host-death family protein
MHSVSFDVAGLVGGVKAEGLIIGTRLAKLAKLPEVAMQYNVHTAKSQLSKLIQSALDGEEVVIARGSKPAVRLVPITKSRFKFGGLEHLAGTVPDFLEPMSEEDLKLWEGGD